MTEKPKQPRIAVSVKVAAAAIGVGRTSWYKLQAQGLGPATIKIGNRRLIRWSTLVEWLKSREQ